MREPLLVGLDIGTTATKAAVFDGGGRLLAAATAAYPVHRPRPGWAEQDPQDWRDATAQVLRELGRSCDLTGVAALGLVSQVNTHAFVDGSHGALGPAIVWQDQRCAAVAAALDARFSAADRERIWGGPFTIDASYLVSRAAWFAEHGAWARTRWVLLPKDLVVADLTGQVTTDPVSAVGLTGPDGYLGEAVELVPGLGERLPPLAEPAAVVGRIGSGRWGLPVGTPVVAGTMDAWGNLYGSGAVGVGDGMLVCGTSEIAAVVSDRIVPTFGVIAFPPRDGLIVHAGPTQAGGDALRWWAQAQGRSIAAVLADAATAPPGAGGVLFLPHLAGQRAPLWDADVRASFLGVSADTTGAELARAVLEGVAMSAREAFDAVAAAAGVPVRGVAVSGGGARSDLWCQIKADVLGRPLGRLAVADSAVLGAALLGG
ncbi:xylulokinase, partial [Catellatospora methionotrophica]|uniref:xylulokinase n=1 Tax=Catellatospora methionotrophica TaxID=121620 RepID=UPI0033D67679